MMKAKDEILQAIKEQMKGILPSGSQVLLFGSRARGDSREDSDWDILILLDKNKIEPSDYDTISYPLFELGWEINECISPILYAWDDWICNHFTPFYKNVEKDSIRIL